MSEKSINSHWPLTIVSALSSLINIFVPILLVRLLSPAEIGEYKIFFLYLALAPALTLTFGIQSNIPYLNRDQSLAKANINASFQLLLTGAIVYTVLVYCLSPFLISVFNWKSLTCNLFIAAIFGSIIHVLLEDCLVAKGKVKTTAWISGIYESLKSVAVISAAIFYKSLDAVFISYVMIVNIKAAISIFYAVKFDFISKEINPEALKRVLFLAAPISLAALLAVCLDKADQLILSATLSADNFALYTIGCLVIPPLFSLEISVMRVCIPKMASLMANNQLQDTIFLYKNACKQLLFLLFPATLFLILFADPVVNLLFTERYSAAATYLKIFALTYFLLSFPSDCIARAKGDSKWILNTSLLFSALSLFITGYAVINFDAYGALISTIGIKALIKAYGLRYSAKSLNCSVLALLPDKKFLVLIFALLPAAMILELYIHKINLLILIALALIAIISVLLILRLYLQKSKSSETRILMLVQNLRIGGLERLVISLANNLSADPSLKVYILAYDCYGLKEDQSLECLVNRQKIIYKKLNKTEGFSFKSLIDISRFIITNKISLVHSHNIGPFLYASLSKLSLLGTVRLIHTNHGFVDMESHPRYKLYERFSSIICDKIICVSQQVYNHYLQLKVNSKKLKVITNALTEYGSQLNSGSIQDIKYNLANSIGNKQLAAKSDYKWILYMARIQRVKGQDIALKVWDILKSKNEVKAVLIFVGPDSDPAYAKEVKQMASDINGNNDLYFIGPTVNCWNWHQASDLFLSLSRSEGLPLAPLEAIQSLKPVVLSNIEGHKIFSEHSILANLDELESVAELLTKILNEKHYFNSDKLIEAKNWLNKQFSQERMCAEYKSIYMKYTVFK